MTARQRERLQAVLEDFAALPQSPERERLIRVMRAIFTEIKILEDRIREQDPAVSSAMTAISLGEAAHRHVLAAVRTFETVGKAALALKISEGTVYRHLLEAARSNEIDETFPIRIQKRYKLDKR